MPHRDGLSTSLEGKGFRRRSRKGARAIGSEKDNPRRSLFPLPPGMSHSKWHCEGRKNWRSLSTKGERIHLKAEVGSAPTIRHEGVNGAASRFTLFDRVRAPLMALGAVSDPLLRFPLAGRAGKGEKRLSAQFECLFKFLGRPAEIFPVEVDLRKKAVQGRKVFLSQADLIEGLQGFIQHLESQAEFGIEEPDHRLFRILFQRLLVDAEKGARILPVRDRDLPGGEER